MATKKTAKKAAPKKPATKARPAAKRAASAGLKLDELSTSFTANDLGKSLAWYRDVVGFSVEERYERDGKLVGVGLRAGKVFLMLSQDDWKKGRRTKGEAFRLYLMTSQDVDAIAKGIVSRGGVLDQPPTNQPWGMRDFSLTDPDGFKLTIATELKKKR
ncbi:MAG TPA: VOC family protein [Thermoanaerobaculia bacterium]|nr:VOC family protein [Thermoanaerobaculia bacterium]HQR67272.1 VOC family protein [Thermoanaerobaculia bacterium]